MSSEWYETTLGDICKFTAGSAFKPEHQGGVSGQYPFIKVSDMNLSGNEIFIRHANNFVSSALRDAMNAKEHPVGATVFAKIGVALQSNRRRLLVKPTIIDNNMMSANPKTEKISSRFLYFLLSTLDFNTISAGSALPYFNVSDLQKMIVRIPRDHCIQREIEEVLGALDDRITLLRETNTTLEAIAQALFKSWFVDFDPVHAKMQGRAPEGLDEATAALFPSSFEESELGPVPKGWRVGIISDLGEVICGKTPPTSNPENYGDIVPFITIPDMHNRLVITSTGRFLSMAGANSQKKKNLSAGSICVSCIATPGLVVRVTRESQTNQQINSVVPLPTWGKSFPLFLLRRIGDAVRAAGSGGSVFHNLSKSGFEAISVLLTSYELAQKFDEMVEPLIARIEANQQQVENLAATRDALLPRLISGQMQLDSREAGDGC
jgi:type I restriction enzyme, S subunit